MELTQLQYFRTVARMQHITQAASVLHVSQPALSRAISRLEDELGVKLFQRDGNRIRLSPCGFVFLDRVDRAMLELDNGVKEIWDMQNEDYGDIHFAAFTSGLVSEPMKEFLLRYPNIRMSHSVMPQEQIKARLENSEVDIALTLFPVESTMVTWLQVAEDELIVLVNDANPISRKSSIDLIELADQKLAVSCSEFGMKDLLEGFCVRAGFSPRIYYESGEGDLVMELLRENACIFVLPASIHIWKVQADRKSMSAGEPNLFSRPFPFSAVRIKNPACSFSYGISVPKDKLMSKSVNAFYTMVIEYFNTMEVIRKSDEYEKLLLM